MEISCNLWERCEDDRTVYDNNFFCNLLQDFFFSFGKGGGGVGGFRLNFFFF